jgi:hypothetical protein
LILDDAVADGVDERADVRIEIPARVELLAGAANLAVRSPAA